MEMPCYHYKNVYCHQSFIGGSAELLLSAEGHRTCININNKRRNSPHISSLSQAENYMLMSIHMIVIIIMVQGAVAAT